MRVAILTSDSMMIQKLHIILYGSQLRKTHSSDNFFGKTIFKDLDLETTLSLIPNLYGRLKNFQLKIR